MRYISSISQSIQKGSHIRRKTDIVKRFRYLVSKTIERLIKARHLKGELNLRMILAHSVTEGELVQLPEK